MTVSLAKLSDNFILDSANRRWGIRRTCIDTPGRAYHARLIDDCDDFAEVLTGVIGFYAETIDDIRHKLQAA